MKSKGFTLMEVMIAVFILTVGVGAALSLMNQTLATASLVEQRLIAAYLAQEGIEIVRNIRDSTWLEKRSDPSLSWDDYIPLGHWEADYDSQALTPYTGNLLNVESLHGLYGYGAADPQAKAMFEREIIIEEVDPLNPDPDKRKVTVRVSWEERGRDHNFTVLEYIENWY